MAFPLQITYRDDLPASDALEAWILAWADKLERVYDRIERGEVVIDTPHRHHRQGRRFRVRIHLSVPGEDITIDRDPGRDEGHEDPYVAVRDSFHAARRRLEDHVRRVRGEIKRHRAPEHARVVYLDRDRAWGWLETRDGRWIYFHRHSVLGGADRLALGDEVRFTEEPGDQGPQASTVELLGEHGRHELPRW